ncbi:hypothetical protein FSARC_590 [Fusarium sarcochroum]|uniref:Fork-head domain-containing protein n=1 Tax=Fusarium sarcochroum TaxID=1208366 RepID=A0A8H4UBP8_9HYPO|nr:hypothetical protein FSARC_590 [Fusarium sarcochroum]
MLSHRRLDTDGPFHPSTDRRLTSQGVRQPSQYGPFEDTRTCTPASNEGYSLRDPRMLAFSTGFSNSLTEVLSCTSSPQELPFRNPAHMKIQQTSPIGEYGHGASAKTQLGTGDPEGAAVGTRSNEPYSKLIYRALMTKLDHTMTLDEIYQWFRDNTDKDLKDQPGTSQGEKVKGWQNSIRYNLSMNENSFLTYTSRTDRGSRNQAFMRQEHKETSGLTPDAAEATSKKASGAKKQYRWRLADSAVKDGVKSTTRYRRKDLKRGTARSRTQHHPYDHRSFEQSSPVSAKKTSDSKRNGSTTKSGLHRCHCLHGTKMPSASCDIMAYPLFIGRMTAMPGMCLSRQVHENMTMPLIAGLPQTAIKQATYSDMEAAPNGREVFGFMLTLPDPVDAYVASSVAANNHDTAVYAYSDGSQDMYATTSPHGFPYGISDAWNSYQGSGGAHPASGEANDRCMDLGADAAHNWSFQRL